MQTAKYPWTRFWSERDAQLRLDEHGYLLDPKSPLGPQVQPDLFTFEYISARLCIVLLGEPGTGKSTEVRSAYETVKAQKPTDRAVLIELASYQSEDRLVREVFDHAELQKWLSESGTLHLFLDSLDECLLRIETVATLLGEKIANLPLARLRLRVACRTSQWPSYFERELGSLFGNSSVLVSEIAPLRKLDVQVAAQQEGIDPAAFCRQAEQLGVVALATKPLTLDFLLRQFKKTGELSGSIQDLYDQGLLRLCEENNPRRRGAGRTGMLSPEGRLAMASRVAAVCAFGRKSGVWTEVNRGDTPDEYAQISELLGSSETVAGQSLAVGESEIRDALQSGLFSSRGAAAVGFSHQAYAEHLAARWVVNHDLAADQIASLVIHAGDPNGPVIPQLHATVARLGSIRPDVFALVADHDPSVLLLCDPTSLTDSQKSALVQAILAAYAGGRLLHTGWELSRFFGRLSHSGLVGQLMPYLTDERLDSAVRQAAVQIAEACHVTELNAALSILISNRSEPLELRVAAMWALRDCPDHSVLDRIKEFGLQPQTDDPDDELKGYALMALWSARAISSAELASALTRPKRANLIGGYASFLYSIFRKHLEESDLVPLLEWATQKPFEELSPFDRVFDALVDRASDHLGSPGVSKALARFALVRVHQHHGLFSSTADREMIESFFSNSSKRHTLVAAMLPEMEQPTDDYIYLLLPHPPFIQSDDLDWVLESLQASRSEKPKQILSLVAARIFDIRNVEHINKLLTAMDQQATLRTALGNLITPIDLDSALAQELRAKEEERRKWEQDIRAEAKPLTPPPQERVALLLDRCEKGDSNAWWQLNLELSREPDSRHYGLESEADLTTLPGWISADESTRSRILEAAAGYLLTGDPHIDQWLGTNTLHRPALAGYRALVLLSKERPTALSSLPPSVWTKWAGAIVGFPMIGDQDRKEPYLQLSREAYRHNATDAIRVQIALINRGNDQHGVVFSSSRLEHCWDDRLEAAILQRIEEGGLKPQSLNELLSLLLRHGSEKGRTRAEEFVKQGLTQQEGADAGMAAARALATWSTDGSWTFLWPLILDHEDFGKQLVIELANGLDAGSRSLLTRLNDDQLADLFLWIDQRFPRVEDPNDDDIGAHSVSPRESLAHWRDSILRYLEQKGTLDACTALEKIASARPGVEWLKAMVARARANTLPKTWIPPAPAQIIELGAAREARLVRNDQELLDLVVSSLQRMETDLQAGGQIQFLWEKASQGTFRPKDEGALTDWIKTHLERELRQRGVLLNREVQIRRGEFTDIHVDAVVQSARPGQYDALHLVIEVKGSWHAELRTAMETQLVNRYLQAAGRQSGIYLVGWFLCDEWDDADYRKGQTPKITLAQARETFAKQARELSTANVRVSAVVIDCAYR